MTHAQNRHQRRQVNRKDPHNSQSGKPIEGILSPVELAHKARRALRRRVIVAQRVKEADLQLLTLQNQIDKVEVIVADSPKDAKLKQTLSNLQHHYRQTLAKKNKALGSAARLKLHFD